MIEFFLFSSLFQQPYELRIDIESGGKNYHALYTSFKLESEENKYV